MIIYLTILTLLNNFQERVNFDNVDKFFIQKIDTKKELNACICFLISINYMLFNFILHIFLQYL